jgi:hypothetical protein
MDPDPDAGGSMPQTNRSGSGSGSCYFRHRLSRRQPKTIFKKVFLLITYHDKDFMMTTGRRAADEGDRPVPERGGAGEHGQRGAPQAHARAQRQGRPDTPPRRQEEGT